MDKATMERKRVVMECVEGMLAANPELAAIAQAACDRGIKMERAKEALGRAFLACLWYAAKEGTSGDPNRDVADRFKSELGKEQAP